MDATLLGRLGRPQDMAAAVAFLCSDDAAYVTGENGGAARAMRNGCRSRLPCRLTNSCEALGNGAGTWCAMALQACSAAITHQAIPFQHLLSPRCTEFKVHFRALSPITVSTP